MNHADLPMMNINIVALATNHFSAENKLGQGGFGPVYKGTLPGGEEIAVKRLSKISGQGLEEFKNEISLIAKLQHRNLVRLLGYCVQGEEKMLIYEYMPNKSLDFFLFDSTKQASLDWGKRFAIIEGIARGLLYLHRDSRLRIIHRDLKASNILLDEEMNPKISDFGMARIFGGNQNEANTNRVVGTYGYMSPEYAMEGLFSVKSDVYSFGVLVLEIVSGRRNTSFRSTDHVNLISYAWDLWTEGRALELVDSSIRQSCKDEELVRCIHLGMICVQDNPTLRPTMAAVMLILESESPSLPMPRQPTFTSSMRASVDRDLYSEGQDLVSNELTATMGKLPDGKIVAIKRLSTSSGQGADEFKNEIMLISKLQHRNLVRLLGCCVDGLEKMLIYEFMPNKSLDTYLFDSTKKAELDWPIRMNIIHGIARGLLYLHRDSLLRIIHRDLKVSNILLDEKMNPKISDFGLARIFEGTQDLASTHKVVGTLGYMSPEYLLAGMFSDKSDVFSFGVLLLEIVSGRKTTSFHYEEQHSSLLAYAWRSWSETKGVDMVDESVAESSNPSEVSRCVNVGLLCVQDHATDRPTMAAVVSMLSGEMSLPRPNQPTFTFQNKTPNVNNFFPGGGQSSSAEKWSVNDITESVVEGR
ncbi:G-type lectin S-receptor-like serine/threonine-protein kinase B120 [Linum perenne]